jgi:hypothetical protein
MALGQLNYTGAACAAPTPMRPGSVHYADGSKVACAPAVKIGQLEEQLGALVNANDRLRSFAHRLDNLRERMLGMCDPSAPPSDACPAPASMMHRIDIETRDLSRIIDTLFSRLESLETL